jgi:hypothetical protein
MATPIQFAEANLVLTAPAGTSPDDVGRLPVFRNGGGLVSCWRLTPAEMVEIAQTGVVWLNVAGRETQPPVFVGGHKADVI